MAYNLIFPSSGGILSKLAVFYSFKFPFRETTEFRDL